MTNVSGNNNNQNVFALNYKALQLEESAKSGRCNQLGTEENVKREDPENLKDGLSVDELQEIDTNNDGVITEAEFKNTMGEGYKTWWDNYTSFYKASQEENDKGEKVITQNLQDGRVVKTVMNGDKVVSSEFVEMNGVKVSQDYADDGISIISETRTKRNGTAQKIDYDEYGTPSRTTTTTKDGTVTVFDSEGRLETIKIKGLYHNVDENKKVSGNDEEAEISFDYANKTAKIGDKVYSNFEIDDDGKVTIKSDDGSRNIMTVSKNEKGETNIWMDVDGNNKKTIGIAQDGAADSIYEYYEDGHYKKHIWCGSGGYREFTWDENGCKETNDYTKDGVRTSKQTYYHGDKIYDNNWMLWDSVTYYNDKGEETSYQQISYDKQEDGSVINTTKYYDKNGGKLKSETVNERDHFGNVLKYTETNHETGVVKTTENVWDESCLDDEGNLKSLFDSNKIKETITTIGSQTITRSFSNGNVMKERFKDSQGDENNNYEKTFTWNLEGKASELTKYNDGRSILDNYDPLGRMLSRIERDKHNLETYRATFKEGQLEEEVTTEYEESNYADVASVEVKDGDGKVVSGKCKLEKILQKLYPDMDDVCLSQLKVKVEKMNNIKLNELIEYTSGTPDLKIPNFKTDGRIIVFE